jgi:flagellar hook-length control protein FliK
MTTNAFTSNIQQGGQVASAATAKKTGKRLGTTGLAELFSNISQQVTSATKSNAVSFKKILEPAKAAASGVPVVRVERAQEKKAKTTDSLLCIANYTVSSPAKASEQSSAAKTVLSTNHASATKSTIDPRSPMHGQTLGNNDSGRTLVTDGPKAKTTAIDQKNTKHSKPSIESNAVSDNSSVNSSASKLQTASVQTALSSEAAAVPASENRIKASAAKGTEKGRYQVSEIENNAKNMIDKQVKPAQSRTEIAYHRQTQESAASEVAAPVSSKSDAKATTVSEQFAPPTVSNADVVNANASTMATNAAANAGAHVHEHVASVAVAAFNKIGQKITVNLNPPELGRISIKFEKNGDEVTGRLEIEKTQTKSQIDLNLSQIVQNLQDSGVQVKRLEVVLLEQPLGNQQEFTDHTQPDRNGNHQSGSERSYSDIPSVLSAKDQFSYDYASDSYFSDKSVNILV